MIGSLVKYKRSGSDTHAGSLHPNSVRKYEHSEQARICKCVKC